MSMQTKTFKFLCKVITKNYKVNITPIIPVSTQIVRQLNVTEIGYCLSAYADVFLQKQNGTSIKLDKNTFINTLKAYYDELTMSETQKKLDKEPNNNKEKLNTLEKEIKKEEEVVKSKVAPTVAKEVTTDSSTKSTTPVQNKKEEVKTTTDSKTESTSTTTSEDNTKTKK